MGVVRAGRLKPPTHHNTSGNAFIGERQVGLSTIHGLGWGWGGAAGVGAIDKQLRRSGLEFSGS